MSALTTSDTETETDANAIMRDEGGKGEGFKEKEWSECARCLDDFVWIF